MSGIPIGITPEIFTYLNSLSSTETTSENQFSNAVESSESQELKKLNLDFHYLSFLIRVSGIKSVLIMGSIIPEFIKLIEKSLPNDGKMMVFDSVPCNDEIEKLFLSHKKISVVRLLHHDDFKTTLPEIFDFIYVNSDEFSSRKYYELCLTKFVKSGTVLCFDNALAFGKIADASNENYDESIIKNLLDFIFHDSRVDSTLIPAGNGLLLARIK